MTEAQKRALVWLYERGGSGVIDRYGRVLAAGEVAKQFDGSTWLRLIASGHMRGKNHRLILTTVGMRAADFEAAF